MSDPSRPRTSNCNRPIMQAGHQVLTLIDTDATLVEGYRYRQVLPGWVLGAATLLSAALFAGYVSPIAAAIGPLSHGLIWFKLGAGSVAVAIIVFSRPDRARPPRTGWLLGGRLQVRTSRGPSTAALTRNSRVIDLLGLLSRSLHRDAQEPPVSGVLCE